jgi:hypothetical protein
MFERQKLIMHPGFASLLVLIAFSMNSRSDTLYLQVRALGFLFWGMGVRGTVLVDGTQDQALAR